MPLHRSTCLGLLLWTMALCVVSQIPYQLVWRGLSTFPYDAFTTFNPWFVGQLAELRAGEGLLALYQDEVPFDIWPSYFFTGVLRQLFILVQPNSAIGHALVQATHVVLMVPAVALLCRSFGVPWRYGAVGGLVFTLAGIHVSLAHHVLAHEALLYLVLTLFCIRTMLLNWEGFSTTHRIAIFALAGITTVSLVRVHHEAILYLIPLAAWALGHLVALHHRSGSGAAVRAVSAIACLAVLVAIASMPMLVTTYELSLVNKTAIDSYDQLGPYFSDSRAFFTSLVLPGFSGSNSAAMPGPFGFGQEATLSYVFLGTLTFPLMVVVLATWWRDRRRGAAATLAITLAIVIGYTLGAGSPVHRLLCEVFPFLVKIGHNYYGLHLLYLIAAFAVAEGLRILIEQRRYSLLVGIALAQFGLAAALFAQARANDGWGPQGSLADFVGVVAGDLRWHAAVVAALVLIALVTGVRIGGNSLYARTSARVGTVRLDRLVLVGLVSLIAVDMLRPIQTAHFLPNRQWVEWGTSALGGFNPSQEVRRFLTAQQRIQQRPLRVVPIFPKGGGWQGNALMATDMHLVGMPGDSGGNRYVEAWLSKGPDAIRLMEFMDRFGVDAVWVSRWGVDDWAAALTRSSLVKVYSSPYGGDVYMRSTVLDEDAVLDGGTLQLPWRDGDGEVVVEQGPVTRTWRFSLPAQLKQSKQPVHIRLPMMWHAGYGIEVGDTTVTGQRSADGTLLIVLPAEASASSATLVVRYPSLPVAIAVQLAAAVYVAMILVFGWASLLSLRKSAPRRTVSPREIGEPAFRRVP